MRWEALFDDLEGQFAAATDADFAGEVASVAEAERSGITLASRVAASRGREVTVRMLSGARLTGAIVDSADQWMLVRAGATESLVPLAAIATVAGLSDRATEGGGLRRRLGLAHVLRGLAQQQAEVRLTIGEWTTPAIIGAVGADYLDVRIDGHDHTMRIAALDVVQSSRGLAA